MLEELMLSHNLLRTLPHTIGLLRRLRVLSVDENQLECLPEELCSCTALSILSVRGNRLQWLPSNMGHLAALRVINVVGNRLTHLPLSLLNLRQLAAIWVCDNQSQPLVPLQREMAPDSTLRLTCFMLPQVAALPAAASHSPSTPPPPSSARRIHFNQTTDSTSPSRLLRSPTPYAKQLRQMARSVRRDSFRQSPSDGVEIKMARVAPIPDRSAWMFGQHRNPTVLQVCETTQALEEMFLESQDLFLQISLPAGAAEDLELSAGEGGIFVEGATGAAEGMLRPRDKILDVDGVDFTKITLAQAKHVLDTSHPLSLMISRP